MRVRRRGAAVEIEAPAKLNLFLEVVGKRDDGYHDLETLMVPIDVRDELRLTLRDDDRVTLDCAWVDPCYGAGAGLPSPERNLAVRAVESFRERFGISQGVDLRLRKRIPMQAGLGGGSSDAAAALLGSAALFRKRARREELLELAAQLGSDVPFFIDGIPAIARGRGERLEALDTAERHILSRMTYVVAKPREGVSTREAFAACRLPARPTSVETFRAALRRGDRDELARATFNRLEEAACATTPAVASMARRFGRTLAFANERRGSVVHAMTGSGSARFAMHGAKAPAVRQYRRLRGGIEDGWIGIARPWIGAGVERQRSRANDESDSAASSK